MARPILLVGLVFIFLIGLTTSRFARGGNAPGSALAVATVANMVALGVVVWLSAAWMNQLDANRQETEAENARIAAIVKSSGAAIIGKDLHGMITSWNEAATKLYGFTAKEAIGQSIHLIAPPGKEAEMDHILDETQAGRSILPFDTVRKRKDETLVEISLSTSLIRDADGNLVGAAAVARDVSDARHIQRLNEIIVEASPASVVMVDPDGKIALVNSAAVESFGYAPDELIGKGVEVLVPDSVRNGHHILRRGFMQEPVARQMGAGRDLYGRKKNGTEFPVEVGLSPVETLDGTFVLCTVIDITQRKLDEATIQRHVATLEQYNEELKRSNAELEQFAYIASHDLQEPLRMVVSYMGLFESRYKGQFDERADKYINYAVDGASRMQQLVNDLLAYSRVGSQGRPFVSVRVDRVLDQVLHGLSGAIAESGTEITRDPMPEVLADELQLGLVFQNLIGNSIKFRGSEPPVIHIGVSEDDAFWTFSVSDNGIGIEPAYAERIFQMFQRLHERGVYEGSGIGLAISKKIIERHGGKIWLDTEPKEGADFRFTLPKERIAA
ncbi:MAG: PAS domain S-box protein [Armatimonadetes bacterium]|nr:PAS domain S-box protein [Armatimonadota bacterium]